LFFIPRNATCAIAASVSLSASFEEHPAAINAVFAAAAIDSFFVDIWLAVARR
jgi:hypothetical protein